MGGAARHTIKLLEFENFICLGGGAPQPKPPKQNGQIEKRITVRDFEDYSINFSIPGVNQYVIRFQILKF